MCCEGCLSSTCWTKDVLRYIYETCWSDLLEELVKKVTGIVVSLSNDLASEASSASCCQSHATVSGKRLVGLHAARIKTVRKLGASEKIICIINRQGGSFVFKIRNTSRVAYGNSHRNSLAYGNSHACKYKFHLHACRVRVTIGNSGLCCCTVLVLRILSARGELPRRPRSLLLYWCYVFCYVFWVLINSLVCCFCTSALGLVLFQIICMLNEWKKMYVVSARALWASFCFRSSACWKNGRKCMLFLHEHSGPRSVSDHLHVEWMEENVCMTENHCTLCSFYFHKKKMVQVHSVKGYLSLSLLCRDQRKECCVPLGNWPQNAPFLPRINESCPRSEPGSLILSSFQRDNKTAIFHAQVQHTDLAPVTDCHQWGLSQHLLGWHCCPTARALTWHMNSMFFSPIDNSHSIKGSGPNHCHSLYPFFSCFFFFFFLVAGCFPESYQWVWPFNCCHETSHLQCCCSAVISWCCRAARWGARALGIHLTADESESASEMKTKTIDTTLPQQKKTGSKIHKFNAKKLRIQLKTENTFIFIFVIKNKILLVWSCLLCDLVHDVWGGNDLHCIPSMHFLSFSDRQCKKQKTLHISLNTLQCMCMFFDTALCKGDANMCNKSTKYAIKVKKQIRLTVTVNIMNTTTWNHHR